NGGKVHGVRVRKTGDGDKQVRERDYSSAYLRRTYREAGTVKNETVANISALAGHLIDLIDARLEGQHLVPAPRPGTLTGSPPPARPQSRRRPRPPTWPPRTRWPGSGACRPCWARRAAIGTWPWP